MESIKPEIGMGVTYLAWTDRHPFTVIEVLRNGKMCIVQEDSAIRVDSNGMSEVQTYEYKRNPEGRVVVLTLRTDGTWREMGTKCLYSLGNRRRYHDYSF